MRTNVASKSTHAPTHEGAPAKSINGEKQLRRLVLSCLLFEDEFYVDGKTIAEHIEEAIRDVDPIVALRLAEEARMTNGLRHVPLLILSTLARHPSVKEFIPKCINRPDEMGELIAIYWRHGKKPLPTPFKKGIARAFTKFNEHSLSKYNKDSAIKLRDVMFLCHPKPVDFEQSQVWKKLIGGYCDSCWHPIKVSDQARLKGLTPCVCKGPEAKLAIADTWETNLSAGADKKDTFTRLIIAKKLGALAVVKNLRNMIESGVDPDLIKHAILNIDTKMIFPYRFISAARYAPQYEPELEKVMFKSSEKINRLTGKTVLLVDVSISMKHPMSEKSEMSRMDAANGLAIICREICDDVQVVSFSNEEVVVPPRRGFALRDAIASSQRHGGTYLGKAINFVNTNLSYDRIIVITDEQSSDRVPDPKCDKAYMINVASYKNGVGYGKWTHIDGFSEQVLRFISEKEKE